METMRLMQLLGLVPFPWPTVIPWALIGLAAE